MWKHLSTRYYDSLFATHYHCQMIPSEWRLNAASSSKHNPGIRAMAEAVSDSVLISALHSIWAWANKYSKLFRLPLADWQHSLLPPSAPSCLPLMLDLFSSVALLLILGAVVPSGYESEFPGCGDFFAGHGGGRGNINPLSRGGDIAGGKGLPSSIWCLCNDWTW